MKRFGLLLFVILLAGCSANTVYVPDGKAVRLRQDVRAKIWALDKDGNQVPGKMTLKNGWYVLPDSEDK